MLRNKEDDLVFKNFLNRTFFDAWRKGDPNTNYSKLELIVTADCVLKCNYCYYKDFSDFTYPKKIRKKQDILKNLDMILAWLEEEKMYPVFDIFSGDFFNLSNAFEFLDKLIKFQIKNNCKNSIVIPTGMSFIGDEKIENKIREYTKFCKDNGFNLYLSASVDGKYCDDNRPFKCGKVRDDDWYDRCFSFCKEMEYLFHPMIYYNHIDKWIDNWNWFQEMFEKHGIPWHSIYLLEVRNDGWTKETVQKYGKVIEYILENIINRSSKTPKEFVHNLLFNGLQTCNMLSFLFRCGRGLPCSIQSDFSVRLGDLKIVPCHRTAYNQFNYGKFVVDSNKIKDIESENLPMMISVQSMNVANSPKCEVCVIKSLCPGGCLGSQFEITGDPFIPIDSVCFLEHTKIYSSLNVLKKNNCLDEILRIAKIDTLKYKTIEFLNNKYFNK